GRSNAMKILLVDSDPNTIQTLLPMLEGTPGNEVRAADSGEKAIEAAAEWGGVDLLVTEVFMEPMNGFTLRNKLQNRHPGVKEIFMSEYDLGPYAEHIEGAPTLQKPVNGQDLFVAIAKR